MVGCDYSLVDHHTFEVGKVIVNNTPDQTGELTEEQHKSLFIRPGSMVLKIYKHSVIRENRWIFRSIFSMRTTVQALVEPVLSAFCESGGAAVLLLSARGVHGASHHGGKMP